MANCLIDTGALIFAAFRPHLLTAGARSVIEDGRQELLASAISVYEVGNKHRLGKLDISADNLADGARHLGVQWLAIDDATMKTAATLRWNNRDPFDRMIAAHAIHRCGGQIVTSDRAFDDVPGIQRVW